MTRAEARPETWLKVTGAGLYCVPGDFHIDPQRAVARAVVTHGHAHGQVRISLTTSRMLRSNYRLGIGPIKPMLRRGISHHGPRAVAIAEVSPAEPLLVDTFC